MRRFFALFAIALAASLFGQQASSINGVAVTALSKVGGVAVASLSKVSGLTIGGSGGGGDITTGLVGWWKFDDGTGTTATDSTANANTGTLIGSPVPSWVTGKIGTYALQFDNADSNGVSTANSSSLNLTGNCTYACWIQNSSGSGALFCHWLSTASGRQIYIYLSGGHIQVDIPYVAAIMTSTATINDGTWHHVAVTRSGTTYVIYIDGAQDSTTTSGASPDSAANGLQLGYSTAGSISMTGSLDDMRVYNRALTSTDIATLYAYR